MTDRLTNKKDFINDAFFCIFLVSVGIGHYFNEMFQIKGTVVIADIALALFVGAWVLTRGVKIERRHYYLLVCFVYMLAMALIERHGVGHILRDIKVFAYFFVPYFYVCRRKDDDEFIKRAVKVTAAMIFATSVAFIIYFFVKGMRTLNLGYVKRTNGLFLTEYIFPLAFVIFLALKDELQAKMGKILYRFMMFMMLVLTIVGWTRSAWLMLPIAFVLYYVLNYFTGIYSYLSKKEIAKRVVIFVLAMILVAVAGGIALKIAAPTMYDALIGRVFSFAQLGKEDAKLDSMLIRLNDILKYKGKIINPRIILGWGFGDMLPGEPSTILENSFVYYIWKYGIVWGALLVYKVLDKFRTMYLRKSKINNAMIAIIIAFFLMGGISGHLNKYYMEPYLALYFLIDVDRFFADKKPFKH